MTLHPRVAVGVLDGQLQRERPPPQLQRLPPRVVNNHRPIPRQVDPGDSQPVGTLAHQIGGESEGDGAPVDLRCSLP
eukprot:630888-Hanusia_phi.AAC.2